MYHLLSLHFADLDSCKRPQRRIANKIIENKSIFCRILSVRYTEYLLQLTATVQAVSTKMLKNSIIGSCYYHWSTNSLLTKGCTQQSSLTNPLLYNTKKLFYYLL